MSDSLREHNRAHIHFPTTFGDRLADAVAAGMGSWTFIITQTAIVIVWMALNVLALVQHWDPYPFILLNLLFSTQAAYAAPIIMMSQNRQAQKDRLRDDQEAREVHMQAQEFVLLKQVNDRQLEILELLREREASQ